MVESAVSLRYIPPNLMMAFGWVGPAVFGHVVGWAGAGRLGVDKNRNVSQGDFLHTGSIKRSSDTCGIWLFQIVLCWG